MISDLPSFTGGASGTGLLAGGDSIAGESRAWSGNFRVGGSDSTANPDNKWSAIKFVSIALFMVGAVWLLKK